MLSVVRPGGTLMASVNFFYDGGSPYHDLAESGWMFHTQA